MSNPARTNDEDDAAIEIDGVMKDFGPPITLGKPDARSLNHVFTTVFGRRLFHFGEKNVYATINSHRRFISDLNLRIRSGTITAVVGPSGSGKSVLLKLMAGTTPVSAGRIQIAGTVASLLELGENLEPALSIRENVELFARLMKLPERQLEAYYRDVIAFSELEKFQDVPIRFFSTGMQMRVSVAITLMSGADIFLIDDVLQVGDLAFQAKCMDRLRAVKEEGKTVVIIVQDEMQLIGIADRLLRLNRGSIAKDEDFTQDRPAIEWDNQGDRFQWHLSPVGAENELVTLLTVEPQLIESGAAPVLRLRFSCRTLKPQKFRPFVDMRHGAVTLFRTLYERNIEITDDKPHDMEFSLDLPISLLSPGTFYIDLGLQSIADADHHGLKTQGLLTLEVEPEKARRERVHAPIQPNLQWTLATLDAVS